MNLDTFSRLSTKGKKRAIVVWSIDGLIIGLGMMTALRLAAVLIHGCAAFVAALVG